ncbi:DUF1116 domain-containing protein [Mesorhizobium sp. LHD-90]|uniref:DUF1116 domain-containing protein n=1 Tax=Mesorhizobium sp. LHD-90 TaxID=3071414 RepID=UPI0027E19CDE|nr:DUF1116 domain-containing protein [Mesorhizobium sp. LHD-90]MDQ6432536.1 DUF1116 domain-containing protein [Mesorhizobium sp. LHD-90]
MPHALTSSSSSTPSDAQAAFDRLCEAHPMLIGIERAGDVIPGMRRDLVLHAGPPISWDRMTSAMRASICGGLVFEGLCTTVEEAEQLAASGEIGFAPAHDHQAAGAMAGTITASMPVFVVEERNSGLRSFVSVNEGLGKALRFGANGPEVLDRLRWIRDSLHPLLKHALAISGPMDLKQMIAEALRRGDEVHNRNKAATSQFFRDIALALVATRAEHGELEKALRFISGNDHFFLSLSIAHAKAVSLYVEELGSGDIVTVMAGNGVEVGIRVASLGKTWFTAPASVANVKFFEGHGEADATPTMGDSYITESIGLGAFALAAAPAISSFIGGTVEELIARSERMREITVGEHRHFRIPALGFRGVPSGIDVRKVVATGISPLINTGIASRVPGVGQIGAGVQQIPLGCFAAALAALERQS